MCDIIRVRGGEMRSGLTCMMLAMADGWATVAPSRLGAAGWVSCMRPTRQAQAWV